MTTAAAALTERPLGRVSAWWAGLSVEERRGVSALLAINPGLVVYYLSVRWESGPWVMIAGAAVLLAFGGRIGGPTPFGATLRLLARSFGVLFLLLPVWFELALRYVEAADFHRDALRLVSRAFPQAPLYGGPHAIEFWLGGVLTVPAVAVAAVWLLGRGDAAFADPRVRRALVLGYLALVAVFALTTSFDRLVAPFMHYASFADDARRFQSLGEVLDTYVGRMSTLGFRTAHYPPGYVLLFVLERTSGLTGLVKMLGYVTAVGVLPLVVVLAREVGLDDARATFALALCASSTGMLEFPSTSPESYFVFLSVAAFIAMHLAMQRRTLTFAVLGGLAVAGATLLSFSVSFVGVLLAVQALIGLGVGAYRWRRVLAAGFLSVLAFVGVFVALDRLAGFDLATCLRQSIDNNQAGMSPSFDAWPRYLLRSTGNLLAYVGSLGPALVAFAAAGALGLRSLPPAQKAMVLAAVVTPVIAAFSGLYFMETERIWLFFTPVLAVAGASAAARRGWSFAVAWSVLFAAVFELGFRHYR